MKAELHPNLADLLHRYARDLAQISPSDSLDARIDRLVAEAATMPRPRPAPESRQRPARRWHRPFAWAAAAGLGVIAISAGIVIGVRLERSSQVASVASFARDAAQQVAWSPEDLGMWPSDSVALTIPAEYSSKGTLVAVNPNAKSRGKRYLIDVVVSNDGTVRIDRIVAADGTPMKPGADQQAEEDVQQSHIH